MRAGEWDADADLGLLQSDEMERMGVPEEKRKGRGKEEYVVQNRARS